MAEQLPPSTDGVSRRTIVTGAAWALPVVAVGASTPFATASTEETLRFVADNRRSAGQENPVQLQGYAPLVGGVRPESVDLSYTDGLTGPATASVDSDGNFTVLVSYQEPAAGAQFTGTVTATLPGGASATATIDVSGPSAEPAATTE